MKVDLVRRITAVAAGFSIIVLYLSFLSGFLGNQIFYPRTTIEIAILLSQFVRFLAVISFRRLRILSFGELFILFTLEAFFLLIPLEAIGLFTGSPFYLELIVDICFSWLSSIALLVPPLAIFRLASGMFQGVSFSSAISSAMTQFEIMSILANLVTAPPTSLEGFSGITKSLVLQAVNGSLINRSSSQAMSTTTNVIFTVSSVAVYVALLVYSTIFTKKNGEEVSSSILIPLLVSTSIILAWIPVAIHFTTSALLVLIVPAVIIIFSIWWYTRE